MSFDDLFRKDRPNKKLQRTVAGIAVPCQSQHTGLASGAFFTQRLPNQSFKPTRESGRA